MFIPAALSIKGSFVIFYLNLCVHRVSAVSHSVMVLKDIITAHPRHCNKSVWVRMTLLTFSRSWYFMILCTGLISRSVICNLWPKRCLRSCQTKENFQYGSSHKKESTKNANVANHEWTIVHWFSLGFYLKICVYVLGDNMLRFGLVLTVDDVHV